MRKQAPESVPSYNGDAAVNGWLRRVLEWLAKQMKVLAERACGAAQFNFEKIRRVARVPLLDRQNGRNGFPQH